MIILDRVLHCLMTEVFQLLELLTMMGMALTLVTFEFIRTRMDHGNKLDKTLMEKVQLTTLDPVLHCLMMEAF